MSQTSPTGQYSKRALLGLVSSASLVVGGCGIGCSEYASQYSCGCVVDRADYEVWYWRNLGEDEEDNNKMIGHATGLRMCESNAQAFAAAVGEDFDYQAYVCVLMEDGQRMEKHRLLSRL